MLACLPEGGQYCIFLKKKKLSSEKWLQVFIASHYRMQLLFVRVVNRYYLESGQLIFFFFFFFGFGFRICMCLSIPFPLSSPPHLLGLFMDPVGFCAC